MEKHIDINSMSIICLSLVTILSSFFLLGLLRIIINNVFKYKYLTLLYIYISYYKNICVDRINYNPHMFVFLIRLFLTITAMLYEILIIKGYI